MFKLLILGGIGYIIYRIFWKKNILTSTKQNDDENELIECSNCHTFVSKNECKFTNNGCLCKECQ